MPEPIWYLALLLQIAAAAVLLVAAATKSAEPATIREVIEALGVPWPRIVAFVLGAGELTTSLALLILPGSAFTAGMVSVLVITFTAAAAISLGRRLQVECACFGSSVSARLGWRQIALAPLWAAVAASVLTVRVVLVDQRFVLAFVLIASVGLVQLVRLAPLLAEHRAQRRIIEGVE